MQTQTIQIRTQTAWLAADTLAKFPGNKTPNGELTSIAADLKKRLDKARGKLPPFCTIRITLSERDVKMIKSAMQRAGESDNISARTSKFFAEIEEQMDARAQRSSNENA